jgi:hypothetical protein
VKLALTLLAKNEADVIDANVAYHLAAGVDLIVATDNGSTDGTLEILEGYEQSGALELIREPSSDFRQGEWVTRMARLAAARGADWVINADADEFWWPRAGDLKEALQRLPGRYGIVHGLWRPFARKATHRAHPEVRVRDGNHDVEGAPLEQLHGWYPLEVFHLPLRTRAQVEGKYAGGARRGLRFVPDGEDSRDAAADALVVGDSELREGLAGNVLVEDTRLRDALRTLAGVDRLPERPHFGAGPLAFPRPSVVDDALFAVEAAVVAGADDVRLRRQVDDLERRLQTIESQRLRRVLNRVLRPSGS